MNQSQKIRVAAAQISPVWLNKLETLKKVEATIIEAGKQEADLIVFGEAIVPGYPFWIGLTDGAKWNSSVQKELHSHYIRNAIEIKNGDLSTICESCKKNKLAAYIGTIERASDRGAHSLYCSLIYINQNGEICSIHRKLRPTYEERLTWAPGDGNGLKVHPLGEFTAGGLNCWENWMPLVRSALYAQGENIHVAVWPGSDHNTKDITKFIARESRSFVVSVSALMRKEDFPEETPHLDLILKNSPEVLANGGTCIAGPDGEWIVEPVINREEVVYKDLDLNHVFEERQNFDVSGHYSRPDVTKLIVNRERQSTVCFNDSKRRDESLKK